MRSTERQPDNGVYLPSALGLLLASGFSLVSCAPLPTESGVSTTNSNVGAASGSFDETEGVFRVRALANLDVAQEIQPPAGLGLDGMNLTIEPGTLTFDMELSIFESTSLA